jgi:histidinol phosphatase-like PHP family hydrolase
VHCNYNDHSGPDMTIQNAIKHAEAIGPVILAFTEHIRKSSYWIPKYVKEIEFYNNSIYPICSTKNYSWP